MTKKKLKELNCDELMLEFAVCFGQLKTSYRFHKCDIKAFDNVVNEMVSRKMFNQETADKISHIAFR